MERKRANQRRYEFRGRSDPRIQPTYYVEQFVRSSWRAVGAACGWKPKLAIRVPLSKPEQDWLDEFWRMNGGK